MVRRSRRALCKKMLHGPYMKYIAKVQKVLHKNIHGIGAIVNGEPKIVGYLPLPDRVEIEVNSSETEDCMMYRYTNNGEFCGDTWHETIANAFSQAEFEYGLTPNDFELTAEE